MFGRTFSESGEYTVNVSVHQTLQIYDLMKLLCPGDFTRYDRRSPDFPLVSRTQSLS